MSSESSNCRIDWRPSPLLCRALPCLGLLAALSLWLSALPALLAIPLGLLALGHGFRLSRQESRRPAFSMQWASDGANSVSMELGDRSPTLSAVKVLVRGPLACVWGRGSDGRIRRFMWYPDTLPANARRSLRLAGGKRVAESAPALATIAG